MKQVIIYTDGGCLGNPGPGGYGVVLQNGEHRKELSGGYSLTTNNRMELMACITGLSALKHRCSVIVYTDSKYIVNSVSKGWARRWKTYGWKRNKHEKAENIDLWDKLLSLIDQHEVEFKWVKGHSGNKENERCDKLAGKAAAKKNLPEDENYVGKKTQFSEPGLFD